MSENAINIKHLNKSFRVNNEKIDILSDINLDIKQGEFISMVGHSGCGKSTILKIIAGLLDYDSGSVSLGEKLVKEPDIDRGMVFQEHRLFPWLTIKENVALGLSRIDKNKREKIVLDHIDLVKLNGFEDAYPHQLSGGMSQRAAIARALVNSPSTLLLDEPFGALDALTRILMQQEILRIWKKEKTTMILVTHDIDEAIYLGDRIIVMSSRPGTIEAILPVELPRPRDRGSAEFAFLKKKIYSYFFKDSELLPEYSI